MRRQGRSHQLSPSLGDLGPGPPTVGVTVHPLHQTGALQTVDDAGDATGGQRRLRGEVAHPESMLRGANQAQQQLELVVGDPGGFDVWPHLRRQALLNLDEETEGGDARIRANVHERRGYPSSVECACSTVCISGSCVAYYCCVYCCLRKYLRKRSEERRVGKECR